MLNHQDALIYTMVLAAAADRDMTDPEVSTIGEIVGHLPIFAEFERGRLPQLASACVDLLQQEDGLDVALKQIREALPSKLRETAYALACDVVAADVKASQEELRLLEMIRHRLEVDRLTAAAIERGARARYSRG
ncbi:hypothetical protein STAQ_06460 [Allostella sp. ATCC 35155]|nr:hypothetical protein STAQ_06460 [Stella sp. ATCC 35155]